MGATCLRTYLMMRTTHTKTDRNGKERYSREELK
jgi:hypothetical protein